MILFFTFDIGLLLGFAVMVIYMFANGTEAVFQSLVSHYSTTMLIAFILSIIVSLLIGAVVDNEKAGRDEPIINTVMSAVFYAVTVPPVILLATNETFGFLGNFAGKNGFLWLVFFGFLFFILYAVVTTLILLVGIGIPLLVQMLIIKISEKTTPAMKSVLYIVFGAVIGIIYYGVLKKYQVFPFSTVLT